MPRPLFTKRRIQLLIVVLVVAGLAAFAWVLRARNSNQRVAVLVISHLPAGFDPTVANTAAAPSAVPDGMVWIPGGEFSMGANDPPDMDEVGMKATEDARPIHRVYVDGFFMDKT